MISEQFTDDASARLLRIENASRNLLEALLRQHGGRPESLAVREAKEWLAAELARPRTTVTLTMGRMTQA